MFDFTPVIQKQAKLSELTTQLTIDDLRQYTNEMIDTLLDLIAICTDADVTFQPIDPQANDKYAAKRGRWGTSSYTLQPAPKSPRFWGPS